jgi:transcriptional regulator with PAS, ATPase and Fis domain
VDVRIITATNRHLDVMVEEGSFRRDLYYRINVIPVIVPPLRERIEDVPLLAESFFRTLQLKSGKDIRAISRPAMDLLMAHSWPGNVRELRSTFEYAFVTCQTASIQPEDLPASIGQAQQASPGPRPRAHRHQPSDREQQQKQELIEALQQAEGNQSRAADILGVSRVTVWHRMKRYGVRAVRRVTD